MIDKETGYKIIEIKYLNYLEEMLKRLESILTMYLVTTSWINLQLSQILRQLLQMVKHIALNTTIWMLLSLSATELNLKEAFDFDNGQHPF